MNCTHCGASLPSGALFCGECGRSVGSAAKPETVKAESRKPEPVKPKWAEDPVTGTSLIDDADEVDVELGPEDVRCEQCDGPVARNDIFCGECGFVSRSVTRAFTSDFTGETRQLNLAEPIADPLPIPVAKPKAVPAPEPKPPPLAPPVPPVQPVPLAPPVPPVPPVRSAPQAAPVPRTQRSFLDEDSDAEDLEATRIVNRVTGNRFVLQFSTGESFTVHGTGLIGRNPQPEPGEFFDHLVRVLDSGKSVSKTHLEFGQEGGAFWVKDRFSGNGTIIREPDISARRAEPDRRYRVVRGTRIDIGEQFFVVS